MGRRFRLAGALLAVVFTATACDDESPTGAEGDQLTQVEAEELAEVVMSTSSVGLVGFAQPPAGGSQATGVRPQALLVVSDTLRQDCPLGGERTTGVQVSIESSETGDSGSISIDGTETHADCGLPFRDGTVVLNGDPNLTVGADMAFADGEPVNPFTASYGGGFAWEFGDRSGTCGIDIDSSISIEMEGEEVTAFTQVVTGSICGQSVDRTTTVTLS